MRELKEGLLDFAVYARTFLVTFCVFAAIPLGLAAGNYVASKAFGDCAKVQTETQFYHHNLPGTSDGTTLNEGVEQ